MSRNRSALGEIQPDPTRFPHGIAFLADYVSDDDVGKPFYAG